MPTEPGPICVALAVDSAAPRHVVLAILSGDGDARYVTTTTGEDTENVVLAAPDAVRIYIGLAGAASAVYAFAVTTTRPGAHQASDLGVPVLASDPCFGGSLSNSDAIDRYVLQGDAGEAFDISLAATDAATIALLRDPAGSVLGRVYSGEAMTFALPETGTYTLELTSSMQSAYVLGVLRGDPGPQPCRPNCIYFAEL